MIFNIIGVGITILIFLIICVIFFSLLYVFFWRGKNKGLLGVTLKVLDFFYLQLKMLMKKFFPSYNFDQVMIEARNELNRERFERTKRRIFLAPHCLRSPECPASSTQYGIQCVLCGLCEYEKIKDEAAKYGYSLFILAGSSFVKKLIEETDPDGILLLGCSYEINKVMMALNGKVTYGITLLQNGCVNTRADMERIFSILGLGM